MTRTIFLITTIALLSACAKEKTPAPLMSLNVVNATTGSQAMKVNYFGYPIIWSRYSANVNTSNSATQIHNPSTLNYGTYGVYTLAEGTTPVVIVPGVDTLTQVYNDKISGSAGDMFSLYLTGPKGHYEAMLVKEKIPVTAIPDSLLNVRVINLSANAPAVNVTVSTTPATKEFTDLSYKTISDFKSYPAKAANGLTIAFQIRNASTDAVIATSSVLLSTYRFRCITLVLQGVVGGTPAPTVQIVRNF